MASFPELQNQTVLITGGANGIGAAMVRAFAQQGAHVEFCDVDASAAAKLVKELGKQATFTKVDLLKEKQISKWIQGVAKRRGGIQTVINNAASDPRIALEDTTTEAWDTLHARNLRAYFLVCREASPHLKAGSSIINFSSITVHNGPPVMSAYVSTKAGITGFSRSLARELGPRGIRVNIISPGWIMTERQLREYVTPAAKKLIRQSQCIPTLNVPEEVADVALFLASDLSRAVTGQEMLVDRGWVHA
ncbi:MAG: Short-chain dehydrogenase/reductase family protein [Verrucomicrobia bacterium]|jgi:NAD(P)-dependent dehydrogenase (short-subunit alcohol dehydrogenase family)|nr:Short-chain dehydrogenase/reductase family protein [Verrucomicrobiota bacterium]